MKAIVLRKYGPPDIMRVEDMEKPTPKGDEVLVQVRATAVNDYDWCMVRGKPDIYRLLFGLTKPKHPIPGMEVSGIVESLGPNVSVFKEGDEVYGDVSEFGFGTFAEYLAVSEKALVLKPKGMTFEEAASLSHAAMLALQALRDIAGMKDSQRILINGGGGGVGTFGLQFAKQLNAEVTGVDSGAKLEKMREIGFDHVIDYKQEDFTRNGQAYDIILDAKTTRPPWNYLRSLRPGGFYVTVGGYLPRILQVLLFGPLLKRLTRKQLRLLALKPNKGIEHFNALFEAGKLKFLIDGPYTLAEIPMAIQHFGEAKHAGKVVISLPGSARTTSD